MAIISPGIGSGVNINALVAELLANERQPIEARLVRKELGIQTTLSGFSSLSSALSQFQETAKALQNESDFMRRRAASSNTELFSATAANNAVNGSYNIQVQQLAQSARVRSDDFDSAESIIGTGNLQITLGTDSFNLTIDESNQTLAGIRDAINQAENNPGIRATIINVDGGSRLVLSSSQTGSENTISVVATDNDVGDGFDLSRLENLTVSQAAQDAIFFIDGQQVTRNNNTVSGAIDGVTFELRKADPDSTATLTVSQDNTNTKNRVQAFVDAYNALNESMRQLTRYDPETESAGPLQGDGVVRNIQGQIRQIISDSIGGLNGGTLAEIGITTNKDNGNLMLDSERLDNVLAADFSAVSRLFTSENGLSKRLDSMIDRFIGNDGIIKSRTNGLQSRLDGIDAERGRLDARLLGLEARYRAQFTAMDIMVGQLRGIGDYLTQQLANLPKPNSVNRNN